MATTTETSEIIFSEGEHASKKLRKIVSQRELSKHESDVRIYEYTSAANPFLSPVPVLAHPASLHESGPTRIIPFDLSSRLNVPYPATSPNLMASFMRIVAKEELETTACATSQAFYIIRGSGVSTIGDDLISWGKGDLFVVPANEHKIVHKANEETAIYWVTDEPLLQYLGVKPSVCKFEITHFKHERMLAEVERIKHQPGAEHRNRMGILLGNKITEDGTKTLTHTLWSLLNVLPAHDAQRPHRHNSVALDLCVAAPSEGVYTLMGPELDAEGWVKNPIRCDWKIGAVFVTPPGWWHSHHNETGEPAWVLPMQDAGLYTHQRTLDIRFSVGPGKISEGAAST